MTKIAGSLSGSGSAPKCHGSGTLLLRLLYQCTEFFVGLPPCIVIHKKIQLKNVNAKFAIYRYLERKKNCRQNGLKFLGAEN
jgi:hypothetical protein